MKIGVGYFNGKNAYESGGRIADEAVKNGRIDRPDLVFAFCGGAVDADAFVQGLRSVIGVGPPIVGGSAVGIITNDALSYEGFPSGAAMIQSDRLHARVASVSDLSRDERMAGKKLGEKLFSETGGKLLLIFYDSIKQPSLADAPPVLNASSALIDGIRETVTPTVPIIGSGLLGDFHFRNPVRQFCGSDVGSQCAVGVLLNGEIEPYYQVMHGCTPKDGIYHTITKTKGPVIYEVDGKPVVELIDDMYGHQKWREQVPVKRLTLGVNHGEKYGECREEDYVNRLIAGVLPGGEGIVIFEPDLSEGTEIVFMLRDSQRMLESAARNSAALMKKIETDGRHPVFGLYIDCAGRAAGFSDTMTEEASEIRRWFNRFNTPLFGFYSGVEVAPLLGKSRGLDWTGVLLTLAIG